MADLFGAIASNDIGKGRLPLVHVTPEAKNGVIFPLTDSDGKPTEVIPKMSTKAELDAEIDRLKAHYLPFFAELAPKSVQTRTRTDITEFDFRHATDDDLTDYSRIVSGAGEWERVKAGHYTGPVGNRTAYYRTEFHCTKPSDGKTLYIHFDGVDYTAEVYVNGVFVGMHEGFFSPFEFDISAVVKNGVNVLTVTVKNDYPYNGTPSAEDGETVFEGDKMYAATGPGYDDPDRGWHHCPPGFGIYQGVYIEERPSVYVSDIFVRPMADSGECEVWCDIFSTDYRPLSEYVITYSIYGQNFDAEVVRDYEYAPVTFRNADDGASVFVSDLTDSEKMQDAVKLCLYHGANTFRLRFPMGNFRTWTQDEPWLYDAVVTVSAGGNTDTADRTFGMRSFRTGEYRGKKGMFYLNGQPIRLRGANTMGYEQQDVMRGDSDALLYDMLMAKACNMNFLRLTQRPVQKEIYRLCDRIGLLIQTDLPVFTNMRRTKFGFGVQMCEEMERLIRPYACTVVSTYINEPFPNASNKPHRHLVRHELEDFFDCCDRATHILNPDRVIKHIDGDYDPPSTTLPDYHTYTMWYNGHGIDMGRVYRGYWLDVPEASYYACGEYGAEGLDNVILMRRRYPAAWLPQNADEEKEWTPGQIKDAQSGNMFYFFYDRQDNLEDWVKESRRYQAYATRLQTEAFRRNSDMVSFAIHLFIDAWPASWMKTIVDCEREPKSAFFAYRDALTPLMVSLRTDRKTFFTGDDVKIEAWVCNDTAKTDDGDRLIFEVTESHGKLIYRGEADARFDGMESRLQGEISFTAPNVNGREKLSVRCLLTDKRGNELHHSDEQIEIFTKIDNVINKNKFITFDEYSENEDEYLSEVEDGGTVIINMMAPGQYRIADSDVSVKACGMRPLHFVSRKTGHRLVSGFEPDDFGRWYSEKNDMMTPLIYATFRADDFTPILLSGNCLRGSAWGQKLFPALACGEKSYGKGKIIINQIDLDSHLSNPIAAIFKNRLSEY
ncbi:MAG: hypothetical protein MJ101_04720 [Clostridia bacterium]|nr:hypothetical protein [Clostridia bacterium]